MSAPPLGRAWALAAMLGCACATEPGEPISSDGTTGAASEGSSASATSHASTSIGEPPAGYEEDDGGTGCTFTCPDPPPPPPSATGGGGNFECQLFDQDCDDEKCTPWANDGGVAWNVTRCASRLDASSSLGGPCTVVGASTSGADSCPIGSMCWGVDPTTLEGTCVAHCGGSPSHPLCDDPDDRCIVENDGSIVMCLPGCHPGVDTCAEGTQCLPTNRGWVCVPSITNPAGNTEECEFLNACEPGSVCADAAVIPGCTTSIGCCTRSCVVGRDAQCPDPSWQCVPWHPPGFAPPGLEDAGHCVGPGPFAPTGYQLHLFLRGDFER